MINFKRPEKPSDFDEKSSEQIKKITEPKANFNDRFWKNYKSYFANAQHNKCAYCEMQTSESGDVEHYRPKSAIFSIKTHGSEQKGSKSVKGRTYVRDCEYGYWWLAYDWNNYLYSCSLCNRIWKKALFPIDNGRAINIDSEKYNYKSPCVNSIEDEDPLLLHPYEEINFSEHFEFTNTGLIKPKAQSKYGKATIETVGLDRTSLVEFRSQTAIMADKLIKSFALSEDAIQADFSAELLLDLGAESAQFSGMVRTMFEQCGLDLSWQDLVEYCANG